MPHPENLCTHVHQVTDEREGTIVCTICGLVLTTQIFQESYACDTNEKEYALVKKINDILNKLNLPVCFTTDILKRCLRMPPRKHLLEYVVYLSLHECGFPISIKDIACVTGISDSKIYDLQDNDQSICLQPKDLIEKYCTMLNLDFKTCSLIKEELPTIIETGHNPLTVIASTIYKYSRRNKLKLSMKQIATVVNISTVSIQRYIRKC
jgi:transcription initiation factor TFIIIB Brf1 subunit/transcription initiation factor TFIIB